MKSPEWKYLEDYKRKQRKEFEKRTPRELATKEAETKSFSYLFVIVLIIGIVCIVMSALMESDEQVAQVLLALFGSVITIVSVLSLFYNLLDLSIIWKLKKNEESFDLKI